MMKSYIVNCLTNGGVVGAFPFNSLEKEEEKEAKKRADAVVNMHKDSKSKASEMKFDVRLIDGTATTEKDWNNFIDNINRGVKKGQEREHIVIPPPGR